MTYHLQLFWIDRWITVEKGSFLALRTIRRSREKQFPCDLYRIRLVLR